MEVHYVNILQSTHIKCDDVDITYVIDWYGIGNCNSCICNMIIDNLTHVMIGE